MKEAHDAIQNGAELPDQLVEAMAQGTFDACDLEVGRLRSCRLLAANHDRIYLRQR